MTVWIFHAVWNTATNKLEFAGANNPLWIFRASGNTGISSAIEIPADKQPIGNFEFESHRNFSLHEFQMENGDMFCMFTDGYADQFGGPKGKKLKYTRLKQMLQEKAHIGTKALHTELAEFFNDWKGGMEQIDDVCIFGVRI